MNKSILAFTAGLIVAFLLSLLMSGTPLQAQASRSKWHQWQIGRVKDMDLYVIQTASKCFYLLHHDGTASLAVTRADGGCQ